MKKYYTNETYPSSIGIYLISFEDSDSNKVYIGSAIQCNKKFNCQNGFRTRWTTHVCQLKRNAHHSTALQAAYNKYGEKKMFFQIIEECNGRDKKEILEREKYFISINDSYKNGYNQKPDSETMEGFTHSEKSKGKMGKTKREKYKKIKENVKDKIIETYQTTRSIKDTCSTLNLSKTLVCSVLKDNEIKIYGRGFSRKKSIFVYNKETKEINRFDSLSSASAYTKVHTGKISAIANNKPKAKSSGGYSFSYTELTAEEFEQKCTPQKRHPKFTDEQKLKMSTRMKNKFVRRYVNIVQKDKNGNVVKAWATSRDLLNDLKLKNMSPVIRCIKGQRKYFRNSTWEAEMEHYYDECKK